MRVTRMYIIQGTNDLYLSCQFSITQGTDDNRFTDDEYESDSSEDNGLVDLVRELPQ